MLIGDLARRLRVTTRTLRHYEAIGLLVPDDVDPVTGYRSYGPAQLLRGMHVEQLKAAGLALDEINAALSDERALGRLLTRRRALLHDELRRTSDRLAVVDALLDATRVADVVLSSPTLVSADATTVVSTAADAAPGELTVCIRRQIQRLRRRLRAEHPGVAWTFAARFPLDLAQLVRVETAAIADGIGDRTAAGTTVWPSFRAVRIDCTGPHVLLPLAYDAAMNAAEQQRCEPSGIVQETYLDVGRAPRTAVCVLVER